MPIVFLVNPSVQSPRLIGVKRMQEKNGLQRVSEFFDNVQDMLSYDIPVDFIQKNQQYNNNHGIGRAGLNGVIVGTVFGFHLAILLVLLIVGSNTSFSTAIVSTAVLRPLPSNSVFY